MASINTAELRRASIEKAPIRMPDEQPVLPAFERLPDEIIQQILQATDSEGFASLALLNSTWRSVAQQAHLYAYHLGRCPSYVMSHGARMPEATDDNLAELRRTFAREVKRNLFAAYLRPHRTEIKLISNSISSSSCPGGEGIQFSSSPSGHHILAFNSSRIYVLDVRGPQLEVKKELKILRRPAATCIKDDGTLLAVLLTEMQVDLYDLTQTPPKRTQSLILDHNPRAIALSPCGTVLAAAYEGGIEVSSLGIDASATDRRAVKCDGVDALAFSFDGTQILGTTVHSSQPNTVILTAPYYDPGSHAAEDSISALWTASILFPNSSRDCSHAVLIQNGRHEEAFWAFTYDRSFETFRAVRIDDLRNGTTYFAGPVPSPASQAKLLPSTLSAASYNGDLVSAGFQGKDIWLYGIPEDLDAVLECNTGDTGGSSSGSPHRRNSGARSGSRPQDGNERPNVPQWQVLCDKQRNTLIDGVKVDALAGVHMVKWVGGFGRSPLQERLVLAARGIDPTRVVTEEEGIDFVDGGRLVLLDFDYRLEDGDTTEICVEVGTAEPEVLEEEYRDIETEVAIVRRRTVVQQRGGRSGGMRTNISTATPRLPPIPMQHLNADQEGEDDDPLLPRRMGGPPRRPDPESPSDEGEGEGEEQEPIDLPYSQGETRSVTTLRRAATAAAVHRRLHPSAATAGRVEYRRADGRAEHPHESDADNWVPPPPPYQKDDPGDAPAFLRHGLPGAASGEEVTPAHDQQATQQTPNLPAAVTPSSTPRSLAASHIPPVPALPPVPPIPEAFRTATHQRLPSSSTMISSQADPQRPDTQDSRYVDNANIYDASPPSSPRMSQIYQTSGSRKVSVASGVSDVHSTPDSGAPYMHSPRHHMSQDVHDAGSSMSQNPQVPVLDLQIPVPPFAQAPGPWGPSTGVPHTADSPQVRRLSNASTWPMAPGPAVPAGPPAGYPYSAPPITMQVDSALVQGYPPAPNAEQLARLQNRRSDVPPRRLSGAFHVPRVPVGSRASGDFSGRRAMPPSAAPQHQQQYAQHNASMSSPYMSHARQQSASSPRVHQSQPRGYHEGRRTPPEEDTPLIISTPKGITGAFDMPDQQGSGRLMNPPILAPVPRHPRPNTQPAVLRPPAERLDTIYSVATLGGGHYQDPGGPSGHLAPPPGTSAAGSQRTHSLNRKQSRAERSAAKNMADAKKRGWNGRRRKSVKRSKKPSDQRDLDAASNAGYPEDTSGRESAWGGSIFSNFHPKDKEYKNREGGKAGGKCALM